MPTDRITTERRKPVNLLLNRLLLSKRPFHCIKRNRIQTTGATMNFVLLAIFFFPLAFAQFGHFFQQGFPFGGGFQQQQQQQEQQAPGRQHKGWTESERGGSRYIISRVFARSHCRYRSALSSRICLSSFFSLRPNSRRLPLSLSVGQTNSTQEVISDYHRAVRISNVLFLIIDLEMRAKDHLSFA